MLNNNVFLEHRRPTGLNFSDPTRHLIYHILFRQDALATTLRVQSVTVISEQRDNHYIQRVSAGTGQGS